MARTYFLSDLANAGKREGYAKIAEAVYYVAPEGLIAVAEVPMGLGLLVERCVGEFVLLKRPKKQPVVLEPHHFLNLLIKPGKLPPNHGLQMM